MNIIRCAAVCGGCGKRVTASSEEELEERTSGWEFSADGEDARCPECREQPRTDRYVCTAAAPWSPEKGRAMHPDAVSLGDTDYGLGVNCAAYRCPHCGLRFEVELPQ